MQNHLVALQSYALNENFKRDHALLYTENFTQRTGEFDFNTLFYDIVMTESATLLYCPKLFNVETLITASTFIIDDKIQPINIKKCSRYDIIKIKSKGKKLTIQNALFNESWDLIKFDSMRFSGKNCLSTLNKNNKLEWIADFVKFHIKHHELDAVVLYDNGSTDYTLEALEKCLQETGISDFLIVSVPQPFGPILKDRNHSFCFLQTALLNLSRDKFFPMANAVLNIDIDELIWKKDKTIFELAQSSFFGFVLFRGEWRLTANNTQTIRHQAHNYLDPTEKSCPTKYCYVPTKIARWCQLGNHRLHLKRTLFRNIVNRLLENTDIGYWHCKSISTNWKYKREAPKTSLTIDQQFKRYFS